MLLKLLLKKAVEMTLKVFNKNKNNFDLTPVLETWINFQSSLSDLGGLEFGFLYELNLENLMERVDLLLNQTLDDKLKRNEKPDSTAGMLLNLKYLVHPSFASYPRQI